MWVFSSEKLEAFLDQLSAGFRRDPLEVALFFVMLGVAIGGPVLLSALSVRRRRARARAEAIERFEAALAARALAPDEAEAAAALARAFSPDPARWTSVLSRAAAFNTAAARGGVEAGLLARLRLHLGLQDVGPQERLHSTVELEPGAPLFVLQGTAQVPARVTALDAEGLEVRVERPIEAARVTLRIPRPTGIYDVEARVLSAPAGALRLAHAEVNAHVQQRQFVRRRVRGEAALRLPDGSSAKVRLADLSGGGARVEGRPAGIREGDEVTLTLAKAGGWQATLRSRVVRLHEDGFGLVFVDVPDAQRDELIRRLR